MAIVKTLIVKGVARFLTDAYMSTIRSGIWNGSTIQVGYGGTGVTSAKGDLYTPVFLSSSGIAACSAAIPHNTKDFKINGTTYSIFTTYTGTAPTIFAPTTLAGTGGYILATNAAKTGLEWVAANSHTHSQYVLLDSGTNEQVIKSSISSLGDGVISLWRATEGGYPMIGFHSGTTKTKWGMLGFSAANTPIFRNTSNTGYLLAHAGNIVNNNITIALNTEKTIATIAGVAIKLKVTGTNNVTTSAVVASSASGTTQITAAQTNPFYNLLEGGTVTRSIQFTSSNITISSTTGGVISFTAASWSGATSEVAGTAGYMPGAAAADRTKFLRGDGSWIALSPSISAGTTDTNKVKITVGGENSSEFTIPYATNADKVDNRHATGFVYWEGDPGKNNMNNIARLFYSVTGMTNLGSSSVDNGDMSGWTHFFSTSYSDGGNGSNSWVFQLACPAGTSNLQFRSRNGGAVTNGTAWTVGWTKIAHAGNVSNKNATITTSSTTIATIAGVDIKAKIPDVTAQAIELASVEKTLKVDTWTDMATVSTYTGTYAIQISSSNVMASGVFTACGGTDSVIDEIPLHVADKGTNTWRPYARISAGQLQMTTNEATGTNREYTIKILKLI